MTDKEILLAIADKFETREYKWLQGVMCQDGKGNSVPPESEEGVAFCMFGALRHHMPNVILTSDRPAMFGIYQAIQNRAVGSHGLISYNDIRCESVDDAISLLREASSLTGEVA